MINQEQPMNFPSKGWRSFLLLSPFFHQLLGMQIFLLNWDPVIVLQTLWGLLLCPLGGKPVLLLPTYFAQWR